ncbi:hypothetical protein D9M68_540750 [compost metagenome]
MVVHTREVVHGLDELIDLRGLGRRQHQFGAGKARCDGLGQGTKVEIGARGGEQFSGAGRPAQSREFAGDPLDGRALVAEAPGQLGQQRCASGIRQVLAPAGEALLVVQGWHLQRWQGFAQSAQGAALIGSDEHQQRQAGQRRGFQAVIVGRRVGQHPCRQIERAAAQPGGAERLGQVLAGQGGTGLQGLDAGQRGTGRCRFRQRGMGGAQQRQQL